MFQWAFRWSFIPALIAGVCLVFCGVADAQFQTFPNAQNGIGLPGFGTLGPFGQQPYGTQQGQPSPFGQAGSSVQTINPIAPESRPKPPPSRLEELYNSRLPVQPGSNASVISGAQNSSRPQNAFGSQNALQAQNTLPTQGTIQTAVPLTQFGYDFFGIPVPLQAAQLGAPQDRYVLGPGDEVNVVFRGPNDGTVTERVNRDGQIILPKLAPIAAAGRTLADFRADLERRVAQTYIDTNVYISLGQLRQVSVLVTGDVRSPGKQVLTALATPLDAILLAGGIAKTGTLRNVVLIRGNQTRTVDLYSIIAQGNAVDLGVLEDGDRIFVPSLQDTVAVAGLVRRPGIYELEKGKSSISARALIELAGGFEIGGSYRLSKVSLQPDGSTQIVPATDEVTISNGEILLINNARDLQTQTVSLMGAVTLPNAYPLSSASTVRQLIRSATDLTPEAYTAFALISRRDMALNVKTLMPFSLSQVLSGQQDIQLQNDDIVYVFTANDIRDLANTVAEETGNGPVLQKVNPNAPTTPGAPGTGGLGTPPGTPTPATNEQSGAQISMAQLGYPGYAGYPVYPGYPGATGYPGVGFPVAGYPQAGTVAVNSTAGLAAGAALQPQSYVPGSVSAPGPFLNPLIPQGQGPLAGQLPTNPALGQTNAQQNRRPVRTNVREEVAKALGVTPEVVGATANENLVWLYDEVKDPGAYLIAQNTNLAELVELAGGPLRTADLTAVEVTSTNIDSVNGTARTVRTDYKGTLNDFKRVRLEALDVIRFRPVFSDRQDGRVLIAGEVRFPGTFDVRRGEHLSSVLARAGGLTDEAYPLGAIFTRKSAAIAEGEANQREAKELEIALAAAAQRGSFTSNVSSPASGAPATGSGGAGDVVTGLIRELRSAPALGRITVTIDPAVLAVHPELDVEVEAGDQLYIPKRPSTVTVTGEVLNTGSFAYRNDMSVKDYIALAGGTRETADEGRTFVVLPDGTARPVQESWLTFNSNQMIPPGSTVVVPVVVAPFSFFTTLNNLVSLTQLTSQLAITAISLKVLGGL